jgi:hypothetical protein
MDDRAGVLGRAALGALDQRLDRELFGIEEHLGIEQLLGARDQRRRDPLREHRILRRPCWRRAIRILRRAGIGGRRLRRGGSRILRSGAGGRSDRRRLLVRIDRLRLRGRPDRH